METIRVTENDDVTVVAQGSTAVDDPIIPKL
jgi:hypothetical protein